MSFKGVCKELSAKIIVDLFLDFDTLKNATTHVFLAVANSHGSKHVEFLQILGTFHKRNP